MAILVSPQINVGGSVAPTNILELVSATEDLLQEEPVELTRTALVTPAIDQLANSSGGYAV